MTVELETSRVSYTGAGTTGPFTIPFYFLANADIRAIKQTIATGAETELALTTDFTLTGAGDEDGGELTLISSLSSSFKLVIFRDPALLQEADYTPNDRFPSETHEQVADRAMMISQRDRDLIERAVRLPDGDTSGATMILPAEVERASKVLGFDADGELAVYDAESAVTEAENVTFAQSGSGATARTVQAKLRDIVSVKDFGATGDGSTDDTAAIQAAITSVGSRAGVYFPQPSSSYKATSTITVSGGGITLFGWNQAGSAIKFAPTAADVLFTFTGSGSAIAQSGIVGLRFVATGETTHVKTAVQVIDGEEIELGHISIADWSDSTNASIGFELQGRQNINCHDITVNCDQPFSLKDTPNTAVVSCDHFHFHNIYAIAHSSQPVFKIASDVWMTNCTWDGYQAWVEGTYGLHWDASSAAERSYNVRIQNVRWEQSANTTGYALYLVPKTFSSALNVENCYTDAGHRGYYIRNFVSGKLTGSMYEGLGEALNVDSSTTISVQDNFFNINAGATLTTTGFVGVFLNNDASGANTTTGDLTANSITSREQFFGQGAVTAPAYARTTAGDMGLDFNNDGPTMSVAGTGITQWKSTGLHPLGHDTFDLGETGNRWSDVFASDSVDSLAAVKAFSGTSIPAGGTAGAGVLVSNTANFGVFFGSGAPSLSAAQGSLYLRSDGSSTSTRLYVNTDGSTGWTNVVTAT